MSISITVEKAVNSNGVKGFIIKDFNLLDREKLPAMYLNKKPCCYKGYWPVRLVVDGEKYQEIKKGDFLTVEEWQNLLAYLRVCGDRLHKINEKLTQMRKEWQGEEKFDI